MLIGQLDLYHYVRHVVEDSKWKHHKKSMREGYNFLRNLLYSHKILMMPCCMRFYKAVSLL